MKDFFSIYITFSLISIPLTIYFCVLLIKAIGELLDLFFNKKSEEILNNKADNISFEIVENNFKKHTEKFNNLDPWLKEHFKVSKQKKALDLQLRRQINKKEIQKINTKIIEQDSILIKFDKKYWDPIFAKRIIGQGTIRETKILNIFKP